MIHVMKLKRVAAGAELIVTIDWKRPEEYERVIEYGSHYDTNAWLYRILGFSGSSRPKLFYIGKVFCSNISERLNQEDHQKRYSRLQKKYPHHKIKISAGEVKIDGNITSKRIDHIETLSIFAARDSEPHLLNKKKVSSCTISDPYVIRNIGYRLSLPKEVHCGVFIRT